MAKKGKPATPKGLKGNKGKTDNMMPAGMKKEISKGGKKGKGY